LLKHLYQPLFKVILSYSKYLENEYLLSST
jgi:hypothetical protein